MNKYYPFKNKEEVLEAIKHNKDKLDNATKEFDKFYLNMRIKSLEEMVKEWDYD